METTHHFNELSESIQEIIRKYGAGEVIDPSVIRRLNTGENRSVIYEIKDSDIILKVFLPKGRNDEDINALIDLDGIEYFPKLYAYQQSQYLFMEKAQGISLPDFIRAGATDAELCKIKGVIIDAFSKMIDRKRRDWDFKLEHIFWSKENGKLTWVDFSICEKDPISFCSKEDELKDFEEEFKEELLWYGRKI